MKIVYDNQPFLPFDLLLQITRDISREQEDKRAAQPKSEDAEKKTNKSQENPIWLFHWGEKSFVPSHIV